jgi:hypothetical protein
MAGALPFHKAGESKYLVHIQGQQMPTKGKETTEKKEENLNNTALKRQEA